MTFSPASCRSVIRLIVPPQYEFENVRDEHSEYKIEIRFITAADKEIIMTLQNASRPVPRLAMINDIAGFGRCSTTVSLPVISVMGVQVCPLPTSILSNHLGFPTCYFDDYTRHMREYLQGWEQLQISFDGVYCGFLGSVEQITIVEEFLQSPLFLDEEGNRSLFLLDPVMGDHGRAYSTVTPLHCSKMKELAARADILTPNITEACLLTDTPYREEGWTDRELTLLCRNLAGERPVKIVITGLRHHCAYRNYIWENGLRSSYEAPAAGDSRPGTGDLFASVLAADAINGVDFKNSVKKAADFTAMCIRGSQEAHIPPQEGVIFEKYLGRLLNQP